MFKLSELSFGATRLEAFLQNEETLFAAPCQGQVSFNPISLIMPSNPTTEDHLVLSLSCIVVTCQARGKFFLPVNILGLCWRRHCSGGVPVSSMSLK